MLTTPFSVVAVSVLLVALCCGRGAVAVSECSARVSGIVVLSVSSALYWFEPRLPEPFPWVHDGGLHSCACTEVFAATEPPDCCGRKVKEKRPLIFFASCLVGCVRSRPCMASLLKGWGDGRDSMQECPMRAKHT